MTARAAAREVLGIPEYRAVWAGQALSVIGDQLARIALAVLVYDRTRSPLATAVAYAGSYLPWLAGGLVLAAAADRWPRRAVLVACDAARGTLVAVMAVPGMPLAVMVALLYAVTLLDGPYYAARAGLYADILPRDQYPTGIAAAATTGQAALVIGFAAGGILAGAAGPRPALAIDAATFGLSALLIRFAVAARPAAAGPAAPMAARVTAGVRLVFADRRLRTCMLFGWLAALYTVPAALAVPLAAALGGGPAAAGLLVAAGPLGTAAGTAAYGRRVSAPRIGPLAALCCAILALFAARPGLAWSLAVIAASGTLACYQVAANTGFMQALRRDQQAAAFGVAASGIWTAQGLAYLAAGAAAEVLPPAVVIAVFGIAGAAAGAALTAASRPRGTAGRAAALPGGGRAGRCCQQEERAGRGDGGAG